MVAVQEDKLLHGLQVHDAVWLRQVQARLYSAHSVEVPELRAPLYCFHLEDVDAL